MSTTTKMRAKVRVGSVMPQLDTYGRIQQERLSLFGVAKTGGYPTDGGDEDNTFAKFSPSVNFDMMIANPALLGTFTVGDTFYVDFTPVPVAAPVAIDAPEKATAADPAAAASAA